MHCKVKDVDFEVDFAGKPKRTDGPFYTHDYGEAASMAIAMAASGRPVHLDELISSEAGARAWGGDEAVEQYREDPDASVHDRVVVRTESKGRVA